MRACDRRKLSDSLRLILVFAVALACGTAGAEPTEPAPPLRLVVELTDGSQLTGETGMTELPVETSYAKVAVPLALIATVTFDNQRETVVLDFANGDRITGAPALENFSIKTLIGQLTVGIEHIVTVRINHEL